jgi:hypothetical protein
VPYGRPKTSTIVDRGNLKECAAALRKAQVTVTAQAFRDGLSAAYHKKLLALSQGFCIGSLVRHSSLSGDPSKRGVVQEALLWKIAEPENG